MLTTTGIHLPSSLTFMFSGDEYSTYTDVDGNDVWLAHGTGVRLVEFDNLDLQEQWDTYQRTYNTLGFLDVLRAMVVDPDEVDTIAFCSDCNDPDFDDELCSTNGGDQVCESCYNNYWFCADCEESYPSTTTTLHDTEVCSGCRMNNWSYCEYCDGWYQDVDGDEHDHQDDDDDDEDGCDCESPAQTFTIRNDGHAPLANDTRVTVTLPAGVISAEGLEEIRGHLRSCAYYLDDTDEQSKFYDLSNDLDTLGDKWQTRDGNYTKRLSRMAYKSYGLKLAPEVVSKVGCIASDHSTAVNFAIETTRDLNRSASDFGHSGSCYWQSYYTSRCTLKSNGAFGLRTFTGTDWNPVSGRAWVMPLRLTDSDRLIPTFDTETPDAFIVFNGYGDLSGYTAARIVSHMAGMTYRKVGFAASPMYINSDSGYLIAPEELASKYTDGHLSLSVDHHSNLYNTEKVLTHA